MTHRTIDQLREAEASLNERLKAVRAEIRGRETSAMSKIAKGYARTLAAHAKASGGEMPTPDELAAMLSGSAPAAPRRRKPKAE